MVLQQMIAKIWILLSVYLSIVLVENPNYFCFNFNCFFMILLQFYACLTILRYVIMLLSHLSPRDYRFGPPWVT